ncbi:hypothetical protein CYMTET_50679 [Cymbomonas tetramitiformis]|uniref:Cyclic nucleotide-binding domain-containing protein n=1 Tax=Cymbomonas tetramitiformis TaxID=36881 RepID=A0AAE0ET85_9CHLO|nr:hypothetical protein CYMTET_50679 [Cymbomonas tetramitiformis]
MMALIGGLLRNLTYIKNLDLDPSRPDMGEELPATVVLFTSSVECASNWDFQAVLDQGTIVEAGTREELMSRRGPYWLMACSQDGIEVVNGAASIKPRRLLSMWPFGAVASEASLIPLTTLFTTRTLHEESLYVEGDKAEHLYILASGALQETFQEASNGDGKRVDGALRTWLMGDSAGEAYLHEEGAWPSTVDAVKTSLVLCLSRSLFQSTLNAMPQLGSTLRQTHDAVCSRLDPNQLSLIWPLTGLPKEHLELVRSAVEVVVMDAFQEIADGAKRPCTALHLVIQGEIQLQSREPARPHELEVSSLKPGHVLGPTVPFVTSEALRNLAQEAVMSARSLKQSFVGRLSEKNMADLRRRHGHDHPLFASIATNIAQYAALTTGATLKAHWLFAGLPDSVLRKMAAFFQVNTEMAGTVLHSPTDNHITTKVLVVIRGELAVTTVSEEDGVEIVTYHSAGSVVNASAALGCKLRHVDTVSLVEVGTKNTVVAFAFADDLLRVIQQGTSMTLQPSLKALVEQLGKTLSLASLQTLGLGELPVESQHMLRALSSVHMLSNGVDALEAVTAFRPLASLIEGLSMNMSGFGSKEQLGVVLRGTLLVDCRDGKPAQRLKSGDAFHSGAIQLRGTSSLHRTVVGAALASTEVDEGGGMAAVVFLDLGTCNRQQGPELTARMAAVTKERDRKRELQHRARAMHSKMRSLMRTLGHLPPFHPMEMWRIARRRMKARRLAGMGESMLRGTKEYIGVDGQERRFTGLEEEVEWLEDQLRQLETQADGQRGKVLTLIYQWRDIGAMPGEPRRVEEAEALLTKQIADDTCEVIQRWIGEVREFRLQKLEELMVSVKTLWKQFPTEDKATSAHRAACLNVAQAKPAPSAFHFQMITDELASVRMRFRPLISSLLREVETVRTELGYQETDEEMAKALRWGLEAPHEDIHRFLQYELKKLKFGLELVRPLRSLGAKNTEHAMEEKEREAQARVQKAYAAGHVDALLLQQQKMREVLVAAPSSSDEEQETTKHADTAWVRNIAKQWQHQPTVALSSKVDGLRQQLVAASEQRGQMLGHGRRLLCELGETDSAAELQLVVWPKRLGREELAACKAAVAGLEAKVQTLENKRDFTLKEVRRLMDRLGISPEEQTSTLVKLTGNRRSLHNQLVNLQKEKVSLEDALQKVDAELALLNSREAEERREAIAATKIQSFVRMNKMRRLVQQIHHLKKMSQEAAEVLGVDPRTDQLALIGLMDTSDVVNWVLNLQERIRFLNSTAVLEKQSNLTKQYTSGKKKSQLPAAELDKVYHNVGKAMSTDKLGMNALKMLEEESHRLQKLAEDRSSSRKGKKKKGKRNLHVSTVHEDSHLGSPEQHSPGESWMQGMEDFPPLPAKPDIGQASPSPAAPSTQDVLLQQILTMQKQQSELLEMQRQQAEDHRLLRADHQRLAQINVELEAKVAAKSGTSDPESAATSAEKLLERRKKLDYVPAASVNPFPTRPATLATRMPQLYDLHGNKTYDALSKKSNSSMKYECMVLAPALSYLHDVVTACNQTLDEHEDSGLALRDLVRHLHEVSNSVHGVYALLCNRWTMLELRGQLEQEPGSSQRGGQEALRAKLQFVEDRVYQAADGVVADEVLQQWLNDFDKNRGRAVLNIASKNAANAETRVPKDPRDRDRWKERKNKEKDGTKQPTDKGGGKGRGGKPAADA